MSPNLYLQAYETSFIISSQNIGLHQTVLLKIYILYNRGSFKFYLTGCQICHTAKWYAWLIWVSYCLLQLPTYCSAVYTSVHMQWIQFRFVTHVLFCYLVLLHLTTHPEATVLISLQNQSWMSFDRLLNLAVCYTEFGRTSNNWVKQVVFRLIYNSYGSGNKYPAFMKSIH